MKSIINIVIFLGTLALLVIWGVSATANWNFGTSLTSDYWLSFVYGGSSVAIDVFKAILVFAAIGAFAAKKYLGTFIIFVLWGMCAAWSLTSGMGFVAMNADDAAATRKATVRATSGDRRQLEAERKHLEALQWDYVIYADADKMHEANNDVAKRKRDDLNRMQGDIAITRANISSLQGGLKNEIALGSADPQALVLAELSGFPVNKVQMAKAWYLALLWEILSSLGWYALYCAKAPSTITQKRLTSDEFSEEISDTYERGNVHHLFESTSDTYDEKKMNKNKRITMEKEIFLQWKKQCLSLKKIAGKKSKDSIESSDLLNDFISYSGLTKVSLTKFNNWMRKALNSSRHVNCGGVVRFRVKLKVDRPLRMAA